MPLPGHTFDRSSSSKEYNVIYLLVYEKIRNQKSHPYFPKNIYKKWDQSSRGSEPHGNSLDYHTKHRSHPFFVATCNDHVQVLQGILGKEAFHEKSKQVRVCPLHHIQTLLQHLLLLLFTQFRGLNQWQQLSLLLLKVLFAMILPM